MITSIYNRGEMLPRTLDSISAQSNKDFDYILVNDGSTDNIDDIVHRFMESSDFPVMYIKKTNGGVHTGRNAGVRESRGELVCFIDADDELSPTAVDVCVHEWDKIPSVERNDYAGVRFCCTYQDGERIGLPFPDDINEMEKWRTLEVFHGPQLSGEHTAVRAGSIMRNNLWPEPENVTFVTENILWTVLEKNYRWRYSNEIIRIYHTDSPYSITRPITRKLDRQEIVNRKWDAAYRLNNPDVYLDDIRKWLKTIILYNVYSRLLREYPSNGEFRFRLVDDCTRFIALLLKIPSLPIAAYYKKRCI